MDTTGQTGPGQPVSLKAAGTELAGNLAVRPGGRGLVVFPHARGVKRNGSEIFVAEMLHEAGLGVLLVDLLTPAESDLDARTATFRFNLALLAQRLTGVADWLEKEPTAGGLPFGYFAVSVGGAAVLAATAERSKAVRAVVLLDGRPDLAENYLARVLAPTLLLVTGNDARLCDLNRTHLAHLGAADKQFVQIASTGDVLEEPTALDEALRLALEWFIAHFDRTTSTAGP